MEFISWFEMHSLEIAGAVFLYFTFRVLWKFTRWLNKP